MYIAIYLFLTLLVILSSVWLMKRKTKMIPQSPQAAEYLLNYFTIAQLERGFFGQTFHNPDTFPPNRCACDTCTYKNEPRPYKQPTQYITVKPKPPYDPYADYEYHPQS